MLSTHGLVRASRENEGNILLKFCFYDLGVFGDADYQSIRIIINGSKFIKIFNKT